VSVINTASAVTLYFVLNSRHNIVYLFLGFKVYSRCRKWEWEMGGNDDRMKIEVMGYMGM